MRLSLLNNDLQSAIKITFGTIFFWNTANMWTQQWTKQFHWLCLAYFKTFWMLYVLIPGSKWFNYNKWCISTNIITRKGSIKKVTKKILNNNIFPCVMFLKEKKLVCGVVSTVRAFVVSEFLTQIGFILFY